MKHHFIAFILSYIVFTALFIVLAIFVKYGLNINITGWVVAGIAVVTFLAGPRFYVVKLQSGQKVMVKWLFSKKTRHF